MGLNINLGGVADGFKPLPAGTYRAFVTDYEVRESGENAKNPGSQYINWEFTVDGGEFNDRKLWSNTSLLPQALFSLKGLLSATDFDVSGEIDLDEVFEEIIGRPVGLVVKQRTYDGEVRNEVKRFKPADEVQEGEADDSLMP